MEPTEIRIPLITLPNFTYEDITKRIQIRERALMCTEYGFFSQMLMRDQRSFAIEEGLWKLEVESVEIRMILETDPRLQYLSIDLWEPKRIFFDALYIIRRRNNLGEVEPEEILS